jgi:L-ascorbate metabolism protein UlaG (beta-lactamase superfamily)
MVSTELTFRWLGVGGFEWRTPEYTLLLDPFVSRPSIWQVLTQRLKPRTELIDQHIPEADAILISHAHYDHLMDAPYLARRTGAPIFGSANSIAIAAAMGVDSDQLKLVVPGDRLQAGPFDLHVYAGAHVALPGITSGTLAEKLEPPLRALDFRMDRCDSCSLGFEGQRWLVWHSVETRGAPEADILVVGPEGGQEYFRELCARVRPSWLIPIHWDNFFSPLSRALQPLPVRRHFPSRLGLGQGRIEHWSLDGNLRVRVYSPKVLAPIPFNALLT